ncbi:hypothetical protein CONCODRAFT_79658 [Conidiobolus coronatus NRRL 28638]|uniref:histone deacetylase n=1 Tax=Conidiobolus coronatus (strain ATCC 28846 / CBS 209.66 / NRRL 28638) TaxID=796925 RepID=A0A137P117_CONC2|nr:hypothetical protein CONCODRAFT_79658 [Conidiobolus coronatus NRRL 28638]|eukprot:KXN68755.1 hypothetical protein CONCODRAFT_79658 [Conidiobolus coronatus NRRL 28638]
MTSKIVSYYYDEEIGNYHYETGHPMKPHRMRMTHDLVTGYGLHNHMKVVQPRRATDAEMTMYHSDEYIDLLKSISFNGIGSNPNIPLFFKSSTTDINHISCHVEDCPTFDGVYDFSAKSAGASLAGANDLNRGKTDVVINWMGGLHHAKSTTASGFCYVNDIVLAILRLLEVHPRVMYIDIDVHHGDGVEEAFYTTDRVMTVSFHKWGTFFPCTGHLGDIGMDQGRGYSVNIPLDYGINDDQYVRLFQKTIDYLLGWYNPGAIVLQCGADSLAQDRLGCFNLSGKGHSACVNHIINKNVPTMLLGGGGYTIRNVARAWTMETGVALGIELNDELPQSEFLGYYGPEYKLNVDCTNMDNGNSEHSLNLLYEQMVENLRNLSFTPSVQTRPIPTNPTRDDEEIDVENDPDKRFDQNFINNHRSNPLEHARETDAHNSYNGSSIRKGSNSTVHGSPTHVDSSMPQQPPKELQRKMSKVGASGLLWNKSISQAHPKSDHEESDEELPIQHIQEEHIEEEDPPSDPIYSTTVFPPMQWETVPSCPRKYPDPSPPASYISVSDHEHAISEDEHHEPSSRRNSTSFEASKQSIEQDSFSATEDDMTDQDLPSSLDDEDSEFGSQSSSPRKAREQILEEQMAELRKLALSEPPNFSFQEVHNGNGPLYPDSPIFQLFQQTSLLLNEEPFQIEHELLPISEGDERSSGMKRSGEFEDREPDSSNKHSKTENPPEEASNPVKENSLEERTHSNLIFEESSRDESGFLDSSKIFDTSMDVDKIEESKEEEEEEEDNKMDIDEEPIPKESSKEEVEVATTQPTVNGHDLDESNDSKSSDILSNTELTEPTEPENKESNEPESTEPASDSGSIDKKVEEEVAKSPAKDETENIEKTNESDKSIPEETEQTTPKPAIAETTEPSESKLKEEPSVEQNSEIEQTDKSTNDTKAEESSKPEDKEEVKAEPKDLDLSKDTPIETNGELDKEAAKKPIEEEQKVKEEDN